MYKPLRNAHAMTRFLLSVLILIALIFTTLSAATLVEIPDFCVVPSLKPAETITVEENTLTPHLATKKTTHVDPTSIL